MRYDDLSDAGIVNYFKFFPINCWWKASFKQLNYRIGKAIRIKTRGVNSLINVPATIWTGERLIYAVDGPVQVWLIEKHTYCLNTISLRHHLQILSRCRNAFVSLIADTHHSDKLNFILGIDNTGDWN